MERFTEWINKHRNKNCATPELEAQGAVDFLCKYLLGENWYVADPVNQEQCNTVIVEEILHRYSKDYKKEYKAYMSYMGIIGGKIE